MTPSRYPWTETMPGFYEPLLPRRPHVSRCGEGWAWEVSDLRKGACDTYDEAIREAEAALGEMLAYTYPVLTAVYDTHLVRGADGQGYPMVGPEVSHEVGWDGSCEGLFDGDLEKVPCRVVAIVPDTMSESWKDFLADFESRRGDGRDGNAEGDR